METKGLRVGLHKRPRINYSVVYQDTRVDTEPKSNLYLKSLCVNRLKHEKGHSHRSWFLITRHVVVDKSFLRLLPTPPLNLFGVEVKTFTSSPPHLSTNIVRNKQTNKKTWPEQWIRFQLSKESPREIQ